MLRRVALASVAGSALGFTATFDSGELAPFVPSGNSRYAGQSTPVKDGGLVLERATSLDEARRV